MRLVVHLLSSLGFLIALAVSATAQVPPVAPTAPSVGAPGLNIPQAPQIQLQQPSRQPAAPRQPSGPQGRVPAPGDPATPVRLAAYLHDGSPVINRGMIWRVFEVNDQQGTMTFTTESTEAQPTLRLRPGTYMVVAAYGRASTAKRLAVGTVPISDTVVLNAGGLRLSASVGDRRLPEARVTYTVQLGPGPGGATVVENARGGRILRLPVGDYYVLSRYGEANALMSGDVRVQPGRLTDVTIHHRAAQITLKLVSERGGEAIANTAWSVLTPGGDTVQESIGAFPSMVLAAGDYTVIARNEGRVFNARFTVEPGQDREVEVLAR